MLQKSQILSRTVNFSFLQKLRWDIQNSFCKRAGECDENNISKHLENAPVSKLLDEAATFDEVSNPEWATSPYPATSAKIIKEESTQIPKINPLDTSIILFPGQGILKVGDVKDYLKFPRVQELFDIANDIMGYDLLKLCLKGPQDVLNRTEFNQPATVVVSLAALEKLQEERPKAFETCVAAAGYSVGELTALIFSGALPYEEGLKLVAIRAAAMQSASELSPQGMISCYCTPTAKPSLICKEAEKWALDIGASNPVCSVAIYLYTQMKIFGGCNEALHYIEKNSSSLGLRKVQRLPVSGAFHTSMMEPALKSFIKGLNTLTIEQPNTTVYSNYSGKTYGKDDKRSKKNLIKQIVSPVKWEQIMHNIYERPAERLFPRTFDVGSKGTMRTLLKNVNAKAAHSCFIY